MRKTFVIALRDYLAAVKTKSFLVSLALMPVLVLGGMLIGRLSRDVVDTTPKKIAVIDRTVGLQSEATTRPMSMLGSAMAATNDAVAAAAEGAAFYQILIDAAQKRDETIRGDDGSPTKAPYEIEPVLLGPDDDLEATRLALSDRVRDGDLFAFIEVGPSIIDTGLEDLAELQEAAAKAMEAEEFEDLQDNPARLLTANLPPEVQALQDMFGIRYSSKSTTNLEVSNWVRGVLSPAVQFRRFDGLDIPPQRFAQLTQPLVVNQRPLAVEAEDGGVDYESQPNPLAGLLVPFFSVFLLFSLIATAAFPLTTNIIEEKQLRIAEVLLGSVRPFELMLGKLLGGVAISLTLAAIYGTGGLILALQTDFLAQIGYDTLAWFVVFAVLATLMVGAMSVAVGAAVTNLKEAQNLQTPVVLLPMLPALVAFNVAQNPHGPIAQAFTWFPLSTPITSVLRLTIRDGMGTIERILAALLSLVTTIVLVWLAGRIFRQGMLRNEKGAGFGEIVRWVTRG
jgi:ABC-2 type transport system permease protein